MKIKGCAKNRGAKNRGAKIKGARKFKGIRFLYFDLVSMGKIHICLVYFVCMTLRCGEIIITIVF